MYLKVYMTDTEPLKDPATFERLLRLVPDERRERVMSKRQTGDRAAGLAAGLLLSMATESMGLAGADEYIRYNAYGKPYYDLAAYGEQCAYRPPRLPQVYFSLSHSHDRAMCVVSDTECGCDVELLRPGVMRSAEAMLHPEEAAELEALGDEAERIKLFFRYWTVKESYVKALGCGYTGLAPRDLRVRQEHFEMKLYKPCSGAIIGSCTDSMSTDDDEQTRLLKAGKSDVGTAEGKATECADIAGRKQSTGHAAKGDCEPATMCKFYEWDLYDGYRYACCVLAPDTETLAQLPDEEPELTEVDLVDYF